MQLAFDKIIRITAVFAQSGTCDGVDPVAGTNRQRRMKQRKENRQPAMLVVQNVARFAGPGVEREPDQEAGELAVAADAEAARPDELGRERGVEFEVLEDAGLGQQMRAVETLDAQAQIEGISDIVEDPVDIARRKRAECRLLKQR